MKPAFRKTPETYFAVFWLTIGALALIFIGFLVAQPKLLFGRSLTAIAPSLFPTIVLASLVVLSIIFLINHYRNPPPISDEPTGLEGWRRGAVFFGIMTLYGLMMVPFGFLISSAFAITALSYQIGNRTVWQIALLAIAGPIILYLIATRLLAVSLPELNAIELFYARILDGPVPTSVEPLPSTEAQ